MADNVEIQGLEFQIVNDSTQAVAGLQNLINTLNRLKTATNGGATGLSKTAQGIRELSNSLKGLNSGDASQKITRLTNALTALSQVGNVKISSSIANQLTAINTALNNLKWTDGDKLTALANGLRPLSELGKANLTTFINQLKKLPEVINDLEAADIDKFTRQMNDLAAAMKPFADEMQKVSNGFSAFPSKIQKLITSTNRYSTSANNATTSTKAWSMALQGIKLSSVVYLSKRIGSAIADYMYGASEWEGIMYRFGRAFGDTAQENYEWIEKLSSALYIDKQTFMQYSSIFGTMLKGYGVATEDAAKMAMNYTELTYDIWAGYNDIYKSFEDAAIAVRSAIAGEVEPIRKAGFTIVDSQLKVTAANVKLSDSTQELNDKIDKLNGVMMSTLDESLLETTAATYGLAYSSQKASEELKSYLRYLTLVDQAKAQDLIGTYAKEMNTAEGFMRTLRQQLKSLSNELGSLFLPVLVKVLPYIQAFVELIRDAIAALASLFGVEIQPVDFSNMSNSLGAGADAAGDLADNLTNAGSAAKKLKQYTAGFDELNVFDPNQGGSGSGGSAGGVAGGSYAGMFDIDKLWDEEIFKNINSQVDELKEKMKNVLVTVASIGAGILAWRVAKRLLTGIETLKNLMSKVRTISGGFKIIGIAGFLDAMSRFSKWAKDFADNGPALDNVVGMLTSFAGGVGYALTLLGHTKLGSIFILIDGLGEIVLAFRDISRNGVNTDNVLDVIHGVGSVLTAVGMLTNNPLMTGIGFISLGIPNVIREIQNIWKVIKEGDWSGVSWGALAIGAIETIGGVLYALGKIKGIINNGNVGKGVTASSVVLQKATDSIGGSLSGFSVPSPKTILKGLGDFALIVGGITLIVEAIGLMMRIPGFEETAETGIECVKTVFCGLGGIVIPLTAISVGMIALSKIGADKIVKGFTDFAIIIGGTTGLITAIGALLTIPYFSTFLSTGVSSVVSVFEGLWEVAVPIGALSGLLIRLGFVSPAVVLSGLAGFALVIGGVEVVLVALGALKQIPGFSWIVGEGGKLLSQLGGILGDFAGSIVNSFLVKVSDSFPEIGENLAKFMENAQPFFTGLNSVNGDSLAAAKNLAEMILILTAANVLDGLTSWFTGGSSMTKFGQDLCEFAPYLAEYSNSIKDIKPETIEASATAAKSLAEFATNLPNEGGLVSWFTGENSLDVWGAKLPDFGKNFKAYSDNVDGVKSDTVEASATAAKSLAEFATNLPNKGGVVSWFTGDNTISSFGSELEVFGQYFSQYYDHICNVDTGKTSAVSAELNAISDWSAGISKETTDNINSFGKSITELAAHFAACGDDITRGFAEKISSTYTISKPLIETWAKSVKTWFTSSSFGGTNYETFQNYAGDIVSGFNDGITSKYVTSKISMTSFANTVNGTFNKSTSYNVFYNIAKDVVRGFNNGINDYYGTTASYMRKWANAAVSTYKNTLDSHSPSKRFMRIGEDTVLGYNLGIVNLGDTTKEVVTDWANSFTDVNPTMNFVVDPSALKYYNSGSFAKSTAVDRNVQRAAATEFADNTLEDISAGVSIANDGVITAIYALLKAVEEKDFSVNIGDNEIGQSYDRYNRARGVRVNTGAFSNAY